MFAFVQQLVLQFVQVGYLGHCHQGKTAQMASDDDGLRVIVAYHAYATRSLELVEFTVKLIAEVTAFYIVNGPDKTLFLAIGGHARTLGAQMAVVVGAIEQVVDAFGPGDHAEESSHIIVYSKCSAKLVKRQRLPPFSERVFRTFAP